MYCPERTAYFKATEQQVLDIAQAGAVFYVLLLHGMSAHFVAYMMWEDQAVLLDPLEVSRGSRMGCLLLLWACTQECCCC